MNIEIHDAALEARIQKLLQATGSSSVEEVLLHLVETQEEQDRWLLENRTTVNAKIRTGIDQLDRGERIPDDRLDAHLAKLKSTFTISSTDGDCKGAIKDVAHDAAECATILLPLFL